MSKINDLIPVPQAIDATWEDWEQAIRWQASTIPGILMEEDTRPLPLELLPENKY